MSVDWGAFAGLEPALAATGRGLLYASGPPANAYLATVARDHTPRVHPVFPILTADALWLFVVQMSPKYRDLRDRGGYALHSLPTPRGGDEFALRGQAIEVDDANTRERIIAATGGQQGLHDFERLFRCTITSALHTHWDGWGTSAAWPSYAKWVAAGAAAGATAGAAAGSTRVKPTNTAEHDTNA